VAINNITVKIEWLEGEYDETLRIWKGLHGKIVSE